MKTRKTLYAAAAAVILAAVFAASCKDPSGLIDSVEVTVMEANNKFLVVTSTDPAPQNLDVNPGLDVTVQFDREVAQASLTGNVVIEETETGTPFTNWVPVYTAGTKTLKIQLSTAFAGNKTYTVKLLQGIRGTDGSALQEPRIWSFKTAEIVTGLFWFGDLVDQASPLPYANLALKAAQGNTNLVPITIKFEGITNYSGISYWLTTDQTAAVNLISPSWESATGLIIERDYTLDNEGTNTLYMRIMVDAYISPPINRTIIVDRTAPAAPGVPDLNYLDDTGSSNSDNYTNKTTYLTFSGTAENGSTVSLRKVLQSGGTPAEIASAASTGSYIFDGLSISAGNYYISAVATDAAGNTGSASGNLALYIDTSPPSSAGISSITIPANAESNYVRGTVTVTGTGADTNGIDYIQFFIDGSSVGSDTTSAYTYSWVTTGYGAGAHTLKVRAWDKAGNYLDSVNHTRYVDNTPPVFDLGSSTIYRNATYTFSPSITEANLHSSAYAWSGTGVTFGTPAAASTTAYCTSDGARTVTLRVRDKAGNDTTGSVTFHWDTTAPVMPSSLNGVVAGYNLIYWYWGTGSDTSSGVAGYQYSLNSGSTWSSTITNLNYMYADTHRTLGPQNVYPNTYTLYVRTVDRAGNVSSNRTYSYAVPDQPIKPVPSLDPANRAPIPKTTTAYWPAYPNTQYYYVYVKVGTAAYTKSGKITATNVPVSNLPGLTDINVYYEAWSGVLKLYTSPTFYYRTPK